MHLVFNSVHGTFTVWMRDLLCSNMAGVYSTLVTNTLTHIAGNPVAKNGLQKKSSSTYRILQSFSTFKIRHLASFCYTHSQKNVSKIKSRDDTTTSHPACISYQWSLRSHMEPQSDMMHMMRIMLGGL